jgi:iron complex outermembrane recepter protein
MHRHHLLGATALTALFLPLQAQAEDAPAPSDNDQIVVTGTRAQGRTKLDSISPVDVLSVESLQQQGTPELATALANVAPSIDFPRPSNTDGTDAIRPITLRGMSPDEALVLIDGIRAHTSAMLNVNGSVGRGSQAVDLNTIPSVALQSIEVLRDGASAQYGSDAIAGVVNLRLRKADHGGGVTFSGGIYDTNVPGTYSQRQVTGEPTQDIQGWQGFKLFGDGFLTLSGDYQHRSATNRADTDPRATNPNPGSVTARTGDPTVFQGSGFANFGKPINDVWSLYGWLGYQYRNTTSAASYRAPSAYSAYGITAIYPGGFLPKINSHSKDLNSALGVKGVVDGWNVDANVSYGRNNIQLWTTNSINYTQGTASQTAFYDGSITYDQLVGGLDVSKEFQVFKSLNVAWGVEGRREGYQIGAGEYSSYAIGTAYSTATAGAQGFVGFQPSNQVNVHRSNISGYVDVEAQVTDGLRLGLAGRGEGYSDFGAVGTGKFSARYDFSPAFALRGTISSGFRAPSLAQQWYTSTSSVIGTTGAYVGVPVLTGTYPSTSTIGTALGGKPLQPERSINYSAGTVVRFGGIDITVDAYLIKVRNALALSENIVNTYSDQVAALLAPYGVTQARFFINGLHITTQGIDAVAHYRWKTDAVGSLDFTLAGNVNSITVDSVPTTTSTLNPAPTLFARSRILTIEEGTPGEKVTGTIDWAKGKIGATLRATYYGNVVNPSSTAASDWSTGTRVITDLELRYQPRDTALNLAIGANNLLDNYPRTVPAALNTTGSGSFPGYSPYGYNGRYLYVRAGLHW